MRIKYRFLVRTIFFLKIPQRSNNEYLRDVDRTKKGICFSRRIKGPAAFSEFVKNTRTSFK